MQFPPWVDQPRTKKARAKNRLKYIIGILAMQATGKASVRAFAEHIGLNHSTISIYIGRGKFSEQCASHIQTQMPGLVQAADLINPLEINAT